MGETPKSATPLRRPEIWALLGRAAWLVFRGRALSRTLAHQFFDSRLGNDLHHPFHCIRAPPLGFAVPHFEEPPLIRVIRVSLPQLRGEIIQVLCFEGL